MMKQKTAAVAAVCAMLVLQAGCAQQKSEASAETTAATTAVVTNLAKPDMTRWQYNAEYDLFLFLPLMSAPRKTATVPTPAK